MNNEKELAFRYDLFISPDWRERFEALVDESINLPTEGRILDVNCGTGSNAIELAERMRGKGEVIGLDPGGERIELARAKAQVKKVADVSFEIGGSGRLRFSDREFDAVIGDASMLHTEQIEPLLHELVRVAEEDAPIVLKLTTHGSFDEFFSIYWEALHDLGIDERVWGDLESLISERLTVSAAEAMSARAGLRSLQSFCSREEFVFESAEQFFESPLIRDIFLDDWLAVVPADKRDAVLSRIGAIIDREGSEVPFEVSVKATVVAGTR